MCKIVKYLLVLFAVGYLQPLVAQDVKQGETLFKQCFTCHTLGKKSTGPDLIGARSKWIDAGEGDQLIEWVKNSDALIASGKSTMANEIKEFSPTVMPAQALSDLEITAIFDYIDAWTPPEPVIVNEDGALNPEIIYVPNYNENLNLFYWLCFATLILLLAILMMSGAIQSLIKSDFFKDRMKNLKDNSPTVLLVILTTCTFLVGSNSFALTFNEPGMAAPGDPWLLIEKSDIYVLVFIDLILLGVILYLRNVFNQIMSVVHKPRTLKVKEKSVGSKISKVLNDSVPIEEEESILMNHEYDGIRELDNNLPPWWLWGFYLTIVVSVFYLLNYHVFKTSELQIDAYNTDMAQKKKEVNEYLTKMAMNVDETSATIMLEPADLEQGKVLFEINCATCHQSDGSGKIGPNLTDKNWIYGYEIKDLFKTVKFGTSNGMPEHASKLKPTQIQQVTSYILSLPEKPGKDPEGTIEEK